MAPQKLGVLLAAEKAAQIQVGNLDGSFVEAFVQFDVGAHLVGQVGWNVNGFEFAFNNDRQEHLGMKLFTVGATTGRLAAFAVTLNEGAWEHLAESAEAADESAAQIEFRVGWHI